MKGFVIFLTHLPPPSALYMREWIKTMLGYCQLDKFQWNVKQDTELFIQGNAYEYIVWEMAAILSRDRLVNIRIAPVSDPVGYGLNRSVPSYDETQQSTDCVHISWDVLHPHEEKHYVWIGNASLQRRHNRCDGVSNHQPRDCLLNRLFRPRSKETSKLRVNGLCAGNSPVTGEFPA